MYPSTSPAAATTPSPAAGSPSPMSSGTNSCPFVLVQNRPGRPLRDARARMDSIFWIAASGSAWHALPPAFGKTDTFRAVS